MGIASSCLAYYFEGTQPLLSMRQPSTTASRAEQHRNPIAVAREWQPRAYSLPLRFVRFSGAAYSEGIEEQRVGRTRVCVYSPAKTVADCFKYRNKIGTDVALEALQDYWHQRRGSMDELLHYARICRVANVMRPYLEALVQ